MMGQRKKFNCEMSVDQYLDKMMKDNEWGDDVMIRAMAIVGNVTFNVSLGFNSCMWPLILTHMLGD